MKKKLLALYSLKYNPFSPDSDPNSDGFQVRNLKLPGRVDGGRLDRRRSLLGQLDQIRRDIDLQGDIDGLDTFYRDALQMVTNDKAIRAFDINREDAPLRDRLMDAGIDYEIRAMEKPSDHCPVWATFDL